MFAGGWSKLAKCRNLTLTGKLPSDRPPTCVNPFNKANAEAFIRADRRIKLEVSHGSTHNIIATLGFFKVSARWVPRELTDERNADRINLQWTPWMLATRQHPLQPLGDWWWNMGASLQSRIKTSIYGMSPPFYRQSQKVHLFGPMKQGLMIKK